MMPFAVINRAAKKCPRAIMPTADLHDNPRVTKEEPSRRLPGAIASQSQYATTKECQCYCSTKWSVLYLQFQLFHVCSETGVGSRSALLQGPRSLSEPADSSRNQASILFSRDGWIVSTVPASCTSCWLTCFSSTENLEAMPGCLPEIDIADTVGSPDVRPATHRKRAASRSCTTQCWPLCFIVSSRFEISRWCVLGRDLDRRLEGGVSAPPDKHIRMSRYLFGELLISPVRHARHGTLHNGLPDFQLGRDLVSSAI